MINTTTKDYLLNYLISHEENKFKFEYSKINQTILSESECDLLLEHFSQCGLIDIKKVNNSALLIKKKVELYDFKEAGGFTKKVMTT